MSKGNNDSGQNLQVRHQPFSLGEWTVIPDEGRLSNEDTSVRLQPKTVQLLSYLAENAHSVVSKEEILSAVWAETVVEEGALTQSIHSLRKALDDDAKNPKYIETIPRRGYRLIAEVSPVMSSAISDNAPDRREPALSRMHLAIGSFVAVALLLSFALWDNLNPVRSSLTPEQEVIGLILEPFDVVATPERQTQIGYLGKAIPERIRQELGRQAGLRIHQTFSGSLERDSDLWQAGIHYRLTGGILNFGKDDLTIRMTLMSTKDGGTLWQETYETDLRGVPRLSFKMVEWLIGVLHLVPEFERPTLLSPSDDAGLAYLRGIAAMSTSRGDTYRQAVHALQEAVTFDPAFTVAHAELSKASSWLFFNGERQFRDLAEASLDLALLQDDTLPEVRLAKAYFHYRIEHDYERAFEEFRYVRDHRPYDNEVLKGMGLARRREGNLPQAVGFLEKVFEESGRQDARSAANLAETYRAMRKFKRAAVWYDITLALKSTHLTRRGDQALNAVLGKECSAMSPTDMGSFVSGCSVQPGWRLLGPIPPKDPPLAYAYILLSLYEINNRTEADQRTELRRLLQFLESPPVSDLELDHASELYFRRAWILNRLGEHKALKALTEEYRQVYQTKLKTNPDYARHHAFLGMTFAWLDEPSAALRHGNEAVTLAEERGAFAAPCQRQHLAVIYLLLGQHGKAIELLAELLETDYQMALTVTELRLDPLWDPLRQQPEFDRLLTLAAN